MMRAMWFLVSCTPEPPERAELPDGPLVVVATTDYSVGALAAVGAGGEVADRLHATGGDPIVRALADGRLLQADRGRGDSLQLYESLDEMPAVSIPLGARANPHDAVVIDGEIWVSQYDRTELLVLDAANGDALHTLDLAAYADADGLPEASDLVFLDGFVYVALQRFRRDDDWTSDDGRILRIDPATREITDSFEVGPSPELATDGEGLWVATGVHFATVGSLGKLDLDEGAVEVLAEEEALGTHLTALGVAGDGLVAIGAAPDGENRMYCGDPATWADGPSYRTGSYLSDLVVAGTDAWVAARTGWLGGEERVGLLRFDAGTCDEVSSPIELLLEPYSLAYWPDAG